MYDGIIGCSPRTPASWCPSVPAEDTKQRLGGGPQVLGPVDDPLGLVAQLESGPVDGLPADRFGAHGAPFCGASGTGAEPGCARRDRGATGTPSRGPPAHRAGFTATAWVAPVIRSGLTAD